MVVPLTDNKEKLNFPLWVRDLRRAEIIAFGAFPFMIFFSSFAIDSYRTATHGWDLSYAPWPLKSAGAVDMTTDEHILTLTAAASGSLIIALADHLIVRYKRQKEEQERRALPEGEAIILRRPWPMEETTQKVPLEDGGKSLETGTKTGEAASP
jgi:hypothetical protein